MRHSIGFFLLLIMLVSCDPDTNHDANTVSAADIVVSVVDDTARFEAAHSKILATAQPFVVPGWVNFDSITGFRMPLTAEEAAVLFPKDFGIPSEVSVSAFATHPIDSVTHGIWYYMEVQSGAANDAAPNKDIWMVLYNKTSGPTAAHCFATSGVGYGYAKADSINSFREVLVESAEKKYVTTSTVVIENGKFVIRDKENTVIAIGNDAEARTRVLLETYFK